MSEIRQLYIKNFRSIKELVWYPKSGLNCLIGSGDSGKSTILDAIDLTLGARRSYSFTDADFHKLDTTVPIEIFVTLGALDDQLKNIESYGLFLRSFDSNTNLISDEPQHEQEVVLTIKLTVGEDLDSDWQLYSERAELSGMERRLSWKHRELVTPARLGATAHQHLGWGSRSVLNKLSEDSLDVSATLASIGRRTRQAFAEQPLEEVNGVLKQVKLIANNLGVPVGDLQALLDVNGVSLSNGAISLHNSDSTPLRQLGTGSLRLLISGLQKAASTSKILIVDEAEFGLEPFRITRLLNELGSKDETPLKQVFITTHSPYVLRELQAEQLHVVRQLAPPPVAPPPVAPPVAPPPVVAQQYSSHKIYSLGGGVQQQATLRACAEAFLSRSVIVAEGKTEIGLIRGIDLFFQDQSSRSIQANGVYCADGGGDSMFERAQIFAQLGYRTAIFKDSDKSVLQSEQTNLVQQANVQVFQWGNENSTEDALFLSCPADQIRNLLNIAVDRKSEDAINAHIQAHSQNLYGLNDCMNSFVDTMRPMLAAAANNKKWYKDIEPAENLARNVVGPNYSRFSTIFTTAIGELFAWANG